MIRAVSLVRVLGLVGLIGLVGPVHATEVELVGVTPGRSAMLVIDGAAPLTLAVGEGVDGVKLEHAGMDSAEVRIDGSLRTLSLVPMQGGFGGSVRGGTIRLKADPRGQFFTDARVNGRSLNFLVDTGASLTTLSRRDADRLGLRYRNGAPARAATANGQVDGWRMTLSSLRVDKVTITDVEALIIDTDLPMGLLGMSFLDHFDLERQGSLLVLRQR